MARSDRPESSNSFQTPWQWGQALLDNLKPVFARAKLECPDANLMFGAFPFTGGKSARVAEAWHAKASADGKARIIINARMYDPSKIALWTTKCCCHLLAPEGSGHGPEFRKIAQSVGLIGSMRHPSPDRWLEDRLNEIVSALGPLPHVHLDADTFRAEGDLVAKPKLRPEGAPKPQTGRLLKVQCTGSVDPTGKKIGCGYNFRIAKSWLDEYGAACPKHGPILLDEPESPKSELPAAAE